MSARRGAVLVTGASTGIGRATALRLAAAGWQVFAGVRRDGDGERLAAEVPHGQLEPVRLDVADDENVSVALERIAATVGDEGLAAVVNNAGIAKGGPIEYLPLEVWREQFAVNVFGLVSVTRAALPLLRRHVAGGRPATVVLIGSNSGRVAAPMTGPYVASKFAVEGIADSLRMELRGSGMRVVLIEPGAVKTPIWDKGRSQADELERELPAEAADRYRDLIAAVRAGIDMQERSGTDPARVAVSVERALTAKRPLARYQVGLDSKLSVVAARLLPDRLKDSLIRRFMKV